MVSAGDQNPVFLDWDNVTLKARQSGFPLLETLGRMLGEEVVRVAGGIQRTDGDARITAAGTTRVSLAKRGVHFRAAARR